jgi:hypothetical protein
LLTVSNANPLKFDFNTVYSANATGIEIECDTSAGPCGAASVVDFQNNIFVGFLNNTANGYPAGGTGDYSNPIYTGTGLDLFGNAGSLYSNNVTYHPKSTWTCPAGHETNAICSDPQLTDETWHLYGYGNMSPTSGSILLGAGVAIPGITLDYNGQTRKTPPSIGAYEQ